MEPVLYLDLILCSQTLCILRPATQSALQVGRAHPVLAKVVFKQRCTVASGQVGVHLRMVTRELCGSQTEPLCLTPGSSLACHIGLEDRPARRPLPLLHGLIEAQG